MKDYIVADSWNIIEEGFNPINNKISESIFSIGNGRMGQRANFEERYTGETLQGNYIAGIYYPDKTRVGWWKNGYPEYFAKVLNAANWIGLNIEINGQVLDLNTVKVLNFRRVLNMKDGYLTRSFSVKFPNGDIIDVVAKRFYSIVDDEAGALKYTITPINFSGKISVESYLDGDIKNQDANYDEKFWKEVSKKQIQNLSLLTLETKKTHFKVCTGILSLFEINNILQKSELRYVEKEKFLSSALELELQAGETLSVIKYVANISSENYDEKELERICQKVLQEISAKGFEAMLMEQANAWRRKWETSDIKIEGDVKAQQAIRFNIFQLNQTYTGKDPRLNIGPKGFTGEKYGGSTYWDTEAYCVPFYLGTSSEEITKNLLIYRYNQLGKAIENAHKLGFNNGAALFPMVTMNGEECHNEWEITFEEIHRNGAIAYAIYNYVRYTGDESYYVGFGLEVLIAIARFWKQRVNWSNEKNAYVILGVTGPNEYENNVNNNWYTNRIAVWCLNYAKEIALKIKTENLNKYQQIVAKTNFSDTEEINDWEQIIGNMYFPQSKELGVFLQQDGYLDKEQILVRNLTERPINQKWSWDRILRSCFIKQADVLQGLYFFEEEFSLETLRRNFEFYEPRTVHESSLSPCIHSILAAKLGDKEKAYEFYLRTARLDLDDYNNDTEDGLHITSMAGTWMSIVEGFAGMRVKNNQLFFNPFLPKQWQLFSFTINFRKSVLKISIDGKGVLIENRSDKSVDVNVFDQAYQVAPNGITTIQTRIINQ